MEEHRVMQLLSNLPRTLVLLGDSRHSWPGTTERAEMRLNALPAEKRKNFKILVFPGQSHHLHMDEPGLLLPAILDFLRGGPEARL